MSWMRFLHRKRSDSELQGEMESYLIEEAADNEARGRPGTTIQTPPSQLRTGRWLEVAADLTLGRWPTSLTTCLSRTSALRLTASNSSAALT